VPIPDGRSLSIDEARKYLAPGEVASARFGKVVMTIVGQPPDDGATRQQRRAAARAARAKS
jgi:hypothetical protein